MICERPWARCLRHLIRVAIFASVRLWPGFAFNLLIFQTFMDAAFRIWVTEIRPLFHSTPTAVGCPCDTSAPDDSLLLAEVTVPIVNVGPGQNWQVDDENAVSIDESRRPILVHTRMLQEWLLAGPQTK